MRIRRVVTVSALAAVLLAGCGGPGSETAPSVPPLVSTSAPPSETPSATPSETPSQTSKVADTLCTRMDPTLVQATLATPAANIQPRNPPAEFGIPTYDVCQLTLSNFPNGPVLNVETSVLPATASRLACA